MERQEAINKIKLIVGRELTELAKENSVAIFKGEKKNKGWAGHTIERYLGLPINSSQSPNFGSWELKTVSLKYLKDGTLTVKETMAITSIDPVNLAKTPFEESHLLAKLQKAVIVGRIWLGPEEKSSILHSVKTFDLSNPEIYGQVKADYEAVRESIIHSGFESLTGKMGIFIQPRTKGKGHGSTTRAFYARVSFLKKYVYPELYLPNQSK